MNKVSGSWGLSLTNYVQTYVYAYTYPPSEGIMSHVDDKTLILS